MMSKSQWDEATFNECAVPERKFVVDTEFVLKKTVELLTDDYFQNKDKNELNSIDTSETDWKEAYNNNHYTILELLNELECYIKQDLERYKGSRTKEFQLKMMLDDCQGWILSDEHYDNKK